MLQKNSAQGSQSEIKTADSLKQEDEAKTLSIEKEKSPNKVKKSSQEDKNLATGEKKKSPNKV